MLVDCFFPDFLIIIKGLKTWFELSRVKLSELYRNDLRRNKNFKLAGDLSYRGFELPRVKLQSMYDGNPGEIDFGLS